MKNNECIKGDCTVSEYSSKECEVKNDIINIQWLNNIIEYSNGGINFVNLVTTENGDLICIASYYYDNTDINKKYFYGLKKNGRPYFIENNKETPFKQIDTGEKRNEGSIYAIKLDGGNKEYIITIGNNQGNFEIYDLDNNDKVYKQDGKTFLNTSYNSFHYVSIFKLKTDNNYYIMNFIAVDKNGNKCLFIIKFLFNHFDIENHHPTTTTPITLLSGETSVSSCFQSENNYIICFLTVLVT